MCKLETLCIVGGEKKRNEILQMSVLDAELSILDEIDSGLDIDALKDVASAVNGLTKPETATIMVTHYKVCRPFAQCAARQLIHVALVVQHLQVREQLYEWA